MPATPSTSTMKSPSVGDLTCSPTPAASIPLSPSTDAPGAIPRASAIAQRCTVAPPAWPLRAGPTQTAIGTSDVVTASANFANSLSLSTERGESSCTTNTTELDALASRRAFIQKSACTRSKSPPIWMTSTRGCVGCADCAAGANDTAAATASNATAISLLMTFSYSDRWR